MDEQRIELAKKNGTHQDLYAEMVNRAIRQKYSISDEVALLRQRDTKPDEFAEYNEYVELCKKQVRQVLGEDNR